MLNKNFWKGCVARIALKCYHRTDPPMALLPLVGSDKEKLMKLLSLVLGQGLQQTSARIVNSRNTVFELQFGN